jgi:hypothetical protein
VTTALKTLSGAFSGTDSAGTPPPDHSARPAPRARAEALTDQAVPEITAALPDGAAPETVEGNGASEPTGTPDASPTPNGVVDSH